MTEKRNRCRQVAFATRKRDSEHLVDSELGVVGFCDVRKMSRMTTNAVGATAYSGSYCHTGKIWTAMQETPGSRAS